MFFFLDTSSNVGLFVKSLNQYLVKIQFLVSQFANLDEKNLNLVNISRHQWGRLQIF